MGHEIDLEETEKDLREKYAEIMATRADSERSDKILTAIMKLHELADISALSRLL